MTHTINVTFNLQDGAGPQLTDWLYAVTSAKGELPWLHGYRMDDRIKTEGALKLREALDEFANQMERVLRLHDHKTGWRERPVAALMRLLELELEEFKVARDHFEVKEARKELVDIANFALIVYDRLSMLDQDKNFYDQEPKAGG